MSRGFLTALSLALAMVLSTAPKAQDGSVMPPVAVLGESDTPAMEQCRFSHQSAQLALLEELRAQGVSLGTEEMVLAREALLLFLRLEAQPIPVDGGTSGFCRGSARIDLLTFDRVTDPVSQQPRMTQLVFYNTGFSFIFSAEEIQSRVNSELRGQVSVAIAAYHGTYRP